MKLRIAVAALALVAVTAACGSKNSDKSAKTTTTAAASTTTAADGSLPSAAGKPCVKRTGDLPKGAPEVPVQVGPAPTKLVIKDLKVGTGPVVPPGATVTVNYIGVACSNGVIFDSSYSRNQTATFPLSGVIAGWTNGIPKMHVGGIRLLGIPAEQAYGANPQPGSGIAPDEALWFVVEVVKLG